MLATTASSPSFGLGHGEVWSGHSLEATGGGGQSEVMLSVYESGGGWWWAPCLRKKWVT